jgi:hypothetical protein
MQEFGLTRHVSCVPKKPNMWNLRSILMSGSKRQKFNFDMLKIFIFTVLKNIRLNIIKLLIYNEVGMIE